jgi:hypothetical protein
MSGTLYEFRINEKMNLKSSTSQNIQSPFQVMAKMIQPKNFNQNEKSYSVSLSGWSNHNIKKIVPKILNLFMKIIFLPPIKMMRRRRRKIYLSLPIQMMIPVHHPVVLSRQSKLMITLHLQMNESNDGNKQSKQPMNHYIN